MATAQFFLGNPENERDRTWLGCLHTGGNPFGTQCRKLSDAETEQDFRGRVQKLRALDQAVGYFPFEWKDDLFQTDYTYAFFDGRTMLTCKHHGWISLAKYLINREEYLGNTAWKHMPKGVPARTEIEQKKINSDFIIGQVFYGDPPPGAG